MSVASRGCRHATLSDVLGGAPWCATKYFSAPDSCLCRRFFGVASSSSSSSPARTAVCCCVCFEEPASRTRSSRAAVPPLTRFFPRFPFPANPSRRSGGFSGTTPMVRITISGWRGFQLVGFTPQPRSLTSSATLALFACKMCGLNCWLSRSGVDAHLRRHFEHS